MGTELDTEAGYSTGYQYGYKTCKENGWTQIEDLSSASFGLDSYSATWEMAWKRGLMAGCADANRDAANFTWPTTGQQQTIPKLNGGGKLILPSGIIKPQTPSQAPAPSSAPGSAPATPGSRTPGGSGTRPEPSRTDPITDNRLPPPDREELPGGPGAGAGTAPGTAPESNTAWWVAGAAGLGLLTWALVAAGKKTGR